MKRLKDIEFGKDSFRWGELTEFEKDKLMLIWGKYIKLIEEHKSLENNIRVLLRSAFIEGMLVGIFDIKYSMKKAIKVRILVTLVLLFTCTLCILYII